MQELEMSVFRNFGKDWALVTAGNMENYNTMTIGWGGLGTLWGRDVATIYVKPIRYTHEFLEKNEYFTVTFFPGEYKKDLSLLGSRSGRDGDKVAATRLTPVAVGESVGFQEACLTLLCRKIYRQDMIREACPRRWRSAGTATRSPTPCMWARSWRSCAEKNILRIRTPAELRRGPFRPIFKALLSPAATAAGRR